MPTNGLYGAALIMALIISTYILWARLVIRPHLTAMEAWKCNVAVHPKLWEHPEVSAIAVYYRR